MTDDILDPGPYLITITGGRIYRHKDDPEGLYRVPGGTTVFRLVGDDYILDMFRKFDVEGTMRVNLEVTCS